MNELFLKIINMSISASWLVLAVLILRLVFKKTPKWINVLLWGIVAIRLICPFTIESPISLIPDSIGSGELISEWMDDYIDDIDIYTLRLNVMYGCIKEYPQDLKKSSRMECKKVLSELNRVLTAFNRSPNASISAFMRCASISSLFQMR